MCDDFFLTPANFNTMVCQLMPTAEFCRGPTKNGGNGGNETKPVETPATFGGNPTPHAPEIYAQTIRKIADFAGKFTKHAGKFTKHAGKFTRSAGKVTISTGKI